MRRYATPDLNPNWHISAVANGCEKKSISEAAMQTRAVRPEGLTVSRPGRKAGNGIDVGMSAKGAALRRCAGPSGLVFHHSLTPS